MRAKELRPHLQSYGLRFAIGGEFETKQIRFAELERLSRLTHGLEGSWSANGRTSLARILQDLGKKGVNHVHLPAYICESVLQPVKQLGFSFSFYPVDTELVAYPDPPANAAVLLVHYFGRINSAAADLRHHSNSGFHLIEDACQALLSDWRSSHTDHVNYLISPRKFAEAPMGGWSNVPSTETDANEFEDIAWKSFATRQTKGNYLQQTNEPVDEEFERFYVQSFNEIEEGFSQISLAAGIPTWTAQLIAGIDWNSVARKRSENHRRLVSEISPSMESPTNLFSDGEVPLGHLVMLQERDRLRETLMRERVFCPVHWNLPREVSPVAFPDAHKLSEHSLTLPIDQRYSPDHMIRLAELLQTHL